MRKLIQLTTTIALLIAFVNIYGQCPCVSCDDNTIGAGKFANAMGRYNSATGYYSSAIGFTNNASGNGSFAIGTFNNSIGEYSATIGSYLESTASNSIIIGSGLQNKPLSNNIANSVMIGGLSDVPTLLITGSDGQEGNTGKVGIGYTEFPLQKLHIKADKEELAAILIEPFNWSGGSSVRSISKKSEGSTNVNGAYLMLGNESHGIEAINNVGLIFNSESNYLFGDGRVGIGVESPKTKLHINGDLLFENNFDGVIMKSPNGKCWKGNINDNGELVFTNIDCDNLSDIDNTEENSQVFIYPNPASNQIIVEYTGNQENIRLKLKTINNTLISTHKIFQGENTIIINDIPSQMIIATFFDTNGNIISSEKVMII